MGKNNITMTLLVVAICVLVVAVPVAIIQTQHTDGITIEITLDPEMENPPAFTDVAKDLNDYCAGRSLDIKWTAKANGMTCVLPKDYDGTVLQLLMLVYTATDRYAITPTDENYENYEPAVKYHDWIFLEPV